jgi:YcxB-like protein
VTFQGFSYIYSVGALITISMLYIVLSSGDEYGDRNTEGLIWILLFIVLFVLAAFILPSLYRKVVLPKQVKQSFEQQKSLSLPFEMELTERGMHTSNELGNNTVPWEYFTKWKENEDIVVLYQSDNIIHMIPKRLFPDPQQLEMVKSLLQKNIVTRATSRFQQN